MNQELFDELLESVKEAGQIVEGKRQPSRTFVVEAIDVRDIRESLNLSQFQFAALVHVSVKTLRNWEQGIRRPGGAAAALLTAIRNDPKNVIAALNANQAHQCNASN
jgi:putative transcriptional regulator